MDSCWSSWLAEPAPVAANEREPDGSTEQAPPPLLRHLDQRASERHMIIRESFPEQWNTSQW